MQLTGHIFSFALDLSEELQITPREITRPRKYKETQNRWRVIVVSGGSNSRNFIISRRTVEAGKEKKSEEYGRFPLGFH